MDSTQSSVPLTKLCGESIAREITVGNYAPNKVEEVVDILQGAIFTYDDEGRLVQMETYDQGILSGETRHYDPESGFMIQRLFYKQGKIHGLLESYDKNRITAAMTFENNSLHGIGTFFNPETGRVQAVMSYRAGKLQGICLIYGEGYLVQESLYSAGIKNGPENTYFPSGRLLEKGIYKEGKKEGEFILYDDQGRVIEKKMYCSGVLINKEEG